MSFQFQQMFNAQTVEPQQPMQPLPTGEYKVIIAESEPTPTKDQTGGYLKLTLKVIDGQFSGRTLIDRLNLYNSNQQAVEIAYRRLSAYCHVTNQFQLQNSAQLHNIPFIAVVGMSKGDDSYNDIKGVKDINGNAPGKSGGSQAAAPQQPQQYAAPQTQPAPGWGAPQQPQQPPPQQPQQGQYAVQNGYPPPSNAPGTGWGAQPNQAPAQPNPNAGQWGAPPPANAPAWTAPQNGQPQQPPQGWGAQQPNQAQPGQPAPWAR
jgi:Protein of unknown function (DUF669)